MPQDSYLLSPKEANAQRRWHFFDAKKHVLGRLATEVAILLRGKHKRAYTDWVDCGDFVVVTNAAHIKLSGNKIDQKFYFSHSGYAGGAKVTPVKRVMERDPRKVVYLAFKRMLPQNRLSRKQMARLKLYKADKHPHAAATQEAAK